MAAVIGSSQDPMLFKVGMDGVFPVVSRIAEFQFSALFCCMVKRSIIASGKPVVDYPLSIISVKLEVARNSRRDNAGKLIELRMCRWIHAGIRDYSTDLELHTRRTLTC
jgi:hypothetical protein